MKVIKNYLWTFPFIGTIICLIAILTPTAFFENVVWNHTIYKWIWGYFYEKLPSSIIVSGLYNDFFQLISSWLTTTTIIACIAILIGSSYKNRNHLKKGLINPVTSLIPAILIIISTSIWMIMMEIAELQIYGLSMWDRYFPHFGLIGMFLGAILIICGFFLSKKYLHQKIT